ncbi:MAG: hypothetical protein JO148_01380 [Acidimicrobiia bacterium]|nr:hypothetical protein [Acidimicrobiia bacterium]
MAFSRAFLKTLVPVAALALLAVACGGGGSAKKAASSGSTTSVESTTTTVAGTTTTAAGAPGIGTATTKAAGPATTAAAKVNGQSAANYTPPAGATPAKPAPAGHYTYDNQATGQNTLGAPPATSTLTINAPQGTQQTSTNDTGSGNQTTTTLDFKPEGVHLVEIKVMQSGQTLDFVGNPPPIAAPTGVKPGQAVDFDLSSNPPGTNIHVHIDFVRMETITIGGQPVDTMVIHQVGTLSGKYTGTQTEDAWVAPQDDIFVKTHSVADVKYGAFSAHSDVTSTLEKLTPS